MPQVVEAEVLDAGALLRQAPGGGALMDAFSGQGEAPARVSPRRFERRHILEATQPGAVGDSGRDVHAKLRFHDVDDLKIEGFNHQNAIHGFSIAVRDRGTYANGEKLPPDFIVIFERACGMAASFHCSRGEVVEAKRVSEGP